MSFYSRIIRPILFLSDPEIIHYKVFKLLKFAFRFPFAKSICTNIYTLSDHRLKTKVFGIDFPNPVGLAAGFDKDAKLINELSAFGFGFIEVGTVTPHAQAGNVKPRMFRLTDDVALINRMGFNNDGVQAMVSHLKKRQPGIIIGGNIGKNKNTLNENAFDDYEKCFRELFPFVDYFAINVSSPNTPGLRSLQEKEPLLKLLQHLQQVNLKLSSTNKSSQHKQKPILLKIAPDLTDKQLDEIVEVVLISNLDGIIATNTTTSREGLTSNSDTITKAGTGGLSGKPLSSRSTDVIRYLSKKSNGRYKIIGVGGIHSENDALEKLNAGASLIQIYTGFIYEGPGLIKKINKKILANRKNS